MTLAAAGAGIGALPSMVHAAEGDDPASISKYPRNSVNFYGMTGLIDMPSAYMQPDAQLNFTSAYFAGNWRNTLSFQILPGVEGGFRYSRIDDYFSNNNDLYDRSIDLKIGLSRETEFWPAFAVGFQDMLGTGIYSAEYLVGSKTVFDDFQLTGGIGWGRLSGVNGFKNPLRGFSESFKSRDEDEGTGKVHFGRFFQGEDAAFFGGVEWLTPIDGLRVKAEYSSDAYDDEQRYGALDRHIPFNFGVEYRPWDGMTLGGYYMYGDAVGVRASFSANPKHALVPQDNGAGPVPVSPRPVDYRVAHPELGEVVDLSNPDKIANGASSSSSAKADLSTVELDEASIGPRWAIVKMQPVDGNLPACAVDEARQLEAEIGAIDGVTFQTAGGAAICSVVLHPAGHAYLAAKARPLMQWDTSWAMDENKRAAVREKLDSLLADDDLVLEQLDLEPSAVAIQIRNKKYLQAPQAVGRAAAILAKTMPASVEQFDITLIEAGLQTVTIRLQRRYFEDQLDQPDADRRSWLTAQVMPSGAEMAGADSGFPHFEWSAGPYVPVSFFDPDDPVRADVLVQGQGTLSFRPGLSTTARLSQRLFGKFDDIERESNSDLEIVRSDIGKYLGQGHPTIDRLTGDALFKLSPTLYARATGGMIETMYGGVSGELLYADPRNSWAVGAELNWVQKRDYDQLFEFQDYDVVTGHASLYFDTGWHDFEVQLDAGRYLAGDYGSTISLSRRFANGWEVGAFATFTDVSFDDYGEGSFDKGVRLSIPLNWMLPYQSRTVYGVDIRPLTRDGGARLNVDNRLYPVVRDLDRNHLRESWGSFWK